MQQLSFFDPPPQPHRVLVWDALDEEQRSRLVRRLARLIAQTLTPRGDRPDERTEQDHG